MSEHIEMYVILDERARALQLHIEPGAKAYCAMFGWDAIPAPVDAGPPPALEEIFAAALTRVGTIAFMNSTRTRVPRGTWSQVGADHWLRLPGILCGIFDRGPICLMATRDSRRARELFSGGIWSMQSQLGLIFSDERLPALTRKLVIDLLTASSARIDRFALPDEVVALVMAGVDGAFVEMISRTAATRASICASVAMECEHRGVPLLPRPSYFGH